MCSTKSYTKFTVSSGFASLKNHNTPSSCDKDSYCRPQPSASFHNVQRAAGESEHGITHIKASDVQIQFELSEVRAKAHELFTVCVHVV